jgi:hypothetical protein
MGGRYKSVNNLEMLKCDPLNWRVEKTYATVNPGEENPEFYIISVGSISQMWNAILIPETMILSFYEMSYSGNGVYRFRVENIEEASELVLKFAKGMNQYENLEGTIYWNG